MKLIRRLLCAALALALGAAFVLSGYADNTAPVAENLELTTYRDTPVQGQLSAVDPEGQILTYRITTMPVKGSVTLGEDGRFVYTPAEGKRGRDYFGYTAEDEAGCVSQEATVIIKIVKPKTAVTYADMADNGAAYAAVWLAENGIYTGSSVGGVAVFGPEEPVSRGEFLAMCMKLTGAELLSGVQTTGFADDSEMAAWLKPYVSTALLNGVVSGYAEETGASFRAGEALTYYEAAVILDRLLALTDVSVRAETAPVWCAQAVANLDACRIGDGTDLAATSALTRAEVACLLCSAGEVLAARN